MAGTGVAMALRSGVGIVLPNRNPTRSENDMTTKEKVARRKLSLLKLDTTGAQDS